MTQWQNRIVGYGEEEPGQLAANPRNWRIHPEAQQQALQGVLGDVGWVQNVIVNRATGYVVDGHARVALAMRHSQAAVPVTYVDLTEEEEALILATLDPIAAMAVADAEQLDSLLQDVAIEDEAVQRLLEDLARDEGLPAPGPAAPGGLDTGEYTLKVESPLYEPTGEQPALTALVDTNRHDVMVRAIAEAPVPEEVREFLRLAATRHLVFNYRNIAEYYVHAQPEVQALMEDSALVIIDFERAVELGYVTLRDDLLALIEDSRKQRDADDE